jgi:hypothetical protein
LSRAVRAKSDIASLTEAERQLLARWINLADHPVRERRRRTRQLGTVVSASCAVALAPWIVLLIMTLPEQHPTQAWRVAWVGFDVTLTAAMAIAGWLGWRRRHLLVVALTVVATLLTCDAWFDITLSWGSPEAVGSVLSAVCIELPLAVFAATGVIMLMTALARMAWRDQGRPGEPPRLWRVPQLLIRQEAHFGAPPVPSEGSAAEGA